MASFQHINRFKVIYLVYFLSLKPEVNFLYQIAQYCAPIKKIPYNERTFNRLYSFNRVRFVPN